MNENETRLTRGYESGSEPKLPGDDSPTLSRRADENPLRRRRVAALRLAPYRDGGGFSARDPFALDREPVPASFGLTREELEAEVARCRAAGWQPCELRERFIDPRTVAA